MVQIFTREMKDIICIEQVNYMIEKYNILFTKIQRKKFDINFMINHPKNNHLQGVLKILPKKPYQNLFLQQINPHEINIIEALYTRMER